MNYYRVTVEEIRGADERLVGSVMATGPLVDAIYKVLSMSDGHLYGDDMEVVLAQLLRCKIDSGYQDFEDLRMKADEYLIGESVPK